MATAFTPTIPDIAPGTTTAGPQNTVSSAMKDLFTASPASLNGTAMPENVIPGTAPVAPISVSSLTTPTSPVQVPAPVATTPTSPTVGLPVGTTTDANGNAIVTTTKTTEKTPLQKTLEKIGGLGDVLGTKADVTKQLQEEQQLAQKTENATKDYNTYNAAKLALQQQVEQLYTKGGGTTAGVNAQAATLVREGNANLANLAIVAQASQGLLTAAQQTIKDKIDAQFSPITDQINFYTKFAELNNNDLTESEKFKLTELATKTKTELADVTKAADDIHNTLLENGAPSTIYSAIDKISNDYVNGKINASEAKTKMYQAAGQYGKKTSTATNTQVVEVGGRKVLIDTKTGATIKDLGVSGSDSGFTPTQVNDGSVRAGVDASVFIGYPKDVQAFFTQTNDTNIQPLKDELKNVASADSSLKDFESFVDKQPYAPSVKTFLKSQGKEAEKIGVQKLMTENPQAGITASDTLESAKKKVPGFLSRIWNSIF